MASYGQNVEVVRGGIYGKDVRNAIADCLSGNIASNFTSLEQAYLDKMASYTPPQAGAGSVSISAIKTDEYLLTIMPVNG